MARKASEPTNRFSLPIGTVLRSLDGVEMTEPDPDAKGGKRKITLAHVIGAALMSDAKAEGVTLTVLDRLDLARRARSGKPMEVKPSTCEAIKALVSVAFAHAPIIAGQALELLGDEASSDL
jgi:hypothetical protein